MSRISTTLAIVLLALGSLAGCQGDSYWRAKQLADLRDAEHDLERNEASRHSSADRVYYPGSGSATYSTSPRSGGFYQDDYWGRGNTVPATDTYAIPRDTYNSSDTSSPAGDTHIDQHGNVHHPYPANPPRDPNLLR